MKLMAIDGNSILNRAFYGIKLLSNSKGRFTNAVTGFMNIFLKEREIINPDSIVAAFDMRKPTFRHEAVATYKANRKGMPDELAEQLPAVKQLLGFLGIKIVECEGYEADDVLGTLARICTESDNQCIILTGDRDSLQLIDKNVNVRLITTKETVLYDENMFREKYGFEPVNLIDLKALMGDSSDNISGVAGIGEKTATTLIKQYATIEKLYDELETANLTKSVYNKLNAGKEAANQSKWLATICKTAPIDNNVCNYSDTKQDLESAASLLNELEMFKMMDRLGLKNLVSDDSPIKSTENELQDEETRIKPVSDINEENINIIKSAECADYLFDYKNSSIIICTDNNFYKSDDKDIILDFISSETKKRTFGAKSHYHFAFENKRNICNLEFDAQIAAYLLNPLSSDYSVIELCRQYGIKCSENNEIFSLSALCDKMAEDITAVQMDSLLTDIEQPLTEVLAAMEFTGICIDTQGVKDFGKELSDDISQCRDQIFSLSGREFNISSPKQLGDILFNVLGLPAKKKTKTGYSTNAEVLEELRLKHPIVEFILEYRQLTKLQSTYVDGLLKTVSDDGRIHSVFKQTETRTGRISSTEPNLQNIPVRTDRGREMRKFFIAEYGKVLLDADYSQIELRIMAHMCGDANMRSAFVNNTDIHTLTASQVFNMPQEMVTPAMRSAAKAVNFGIIYGIGAFSLSKDINVSVAEADQYIKSYLTNFPGAKKFMNETVESAVENGYVKTMFGRRRTIPELKSSNKILQAQGKRIAMNTPIQGTAADIIKIAMIRVYKRLAEEKLRARLILQVHDELIVEADRDDAKRAAEILSEEMTNAVKLSIPLVADVNQGETWYDAKG